MTLLQALRRWQMIFYRETRDTPALLPLTRDELDIIQRQTNPDEIGRYTGPMISNFPVVFGTDVFESPFGAEMRDRQVKMPVEKVYISDKTSVSLNLTIDQHRDPFTDVLVRRLTAHVCKDTTKVSATFEFDPFATLKRALRITKWFPVKKRTIEIDGRVLYPYLNITFPMNRHHVTFAVRPS